ncbi:MAG TPA: hypothetical protein VGJ92_13530 [Methanocella sp.]|jgi:type II secretory pathway pseudopilin PulG
MAPKHNKNKNLLFIGIAVAVILVILVAGLGYLYMEDQNRQNQKREELKQAFGDQRNETERQYALIGAYPAAGNKNYVEDYQKWVGGYRTLADNYSLAVTTLKANGTAYQLMLANESSDYANVTAACTDANNKARTINSTATGYERDYEARLTLKTNASVAFDLAVEQSKALYSKAWNLMQDNANFQQYGGYLKFLEACRLNNSYYNNSIAKAGNVGGTYQTYLMGSEYYAVNTTMLGLQDDASKLGRRYLELQKTNVTLTVMNEEINQAWSADTGLYETVSFYLMNENRKNGVLPNRAWNIVVHYSLIDTATGAVRDTCDVSVPEFSYYISDIYSGKLKCDQGHEYKTAYTITCDY